MKNGQGNDNRRASFWDAPMDEIAYQVFAAHDAALEDEAARLEERMDDKAVTEAEYAQTRATLKARAEELAGIRRDYEGLKPHGGEPGAHLMGENGTIRMYILHSERRVWIETNGRKTVELLDPTVSRIMKWRRILGI